MQSYNILIDNLFLKNYLTNIFNNKFSPNKIRISDILRLLCVSCVSSGTICRCHLLSHTLLILYYVSMPLTVPQVTHHVLCEWCHLLSHRLLIMYYVSMPPTVPQVTHHVLCVDATNCPTGYSSCTICRCHLLSHRLLIVYYVLMPPTVPQVTHHVLCRCHLMSLLIMYYLSMPPTVPQVTHHVLCVDATNCPTGYSLRRLHKNTCGRLRKRQSNSPRRMLGLLWVNQFKQKNIMIWEK